MDRLQELREKQRKLEEELANSGLPVPISHVNTHLPTNGRRLSTIGGPDVRKPPREKESLSSRMQQSLSRSEVPSNKPNSSSKIEELMLKRLSTQQTIRNADRELLRLSNALAEVVDPVASNSYQEKSDELKVVNVLNINTNKWEVKYANNGVYIGEHGETDEVLDTARDRTTDSMELYVPENSQAPPGKTRRKVRQSERLEKWYNSIDPDWSERIRRIVRRAEKRQQQSPCVPGPFSFEAREASKPKTIARKKFEADLAEKREKEEALLDQRFQHRPVPRSTSFSLYSVMAEQWASKAKRFRERRRAMTPPPMTQGDSLLGNQSFRDRLSARRKSRIIEDLIRSEEELQRKVNFKAKGVPSNVIQPKWLEIKENEKCRRHHLQKTSEDRMMYYQNCRRRQGIQERAMSGSRRDARYEEEHSFPYKPKVNKGVPNFEHEWLKAKQRFGRSFDGKKLHGQDTSKPSTEIKDALQEMDKSFDKMSSRKSRPKANGAKIRGRPRKRRDSKIVYRSLSAPLTRMLEDRVAELIDFPTGGEEKNVSSCPAVVAVSVTPETLDMLKFHSTAATDNRIHFIKTKEMKQKEREKLKMEEERKRIQIQKKASKRVSEAWILENEKRDLCKTDWERKIKENIHYMNEKTSEYYKGIADAIKRREEEKTLSFTIPPAQLKRAKVEAALAAERKFDDILRQSGVSKAEINRLKKHKESFDPLLDSFTGATEGKQQITVPDIKESPRDSHGDHLDSHRELAASTTSSSSSSASVETAKNDASVLQQSVVGSVAEASYKTAFEAEEVEKKLDPKPASRSSSSSSSSSKKSSTSSSSSSSSKSSSGS